MTRITASQPISLDDIRKLAKGRFGDMVKAVVDIRRDIMLLDADMHADEQSNEYGSTSASMQKYFDAYAIAARKR